MTLLQSTEHGFQGLTYYFLSFILVCWFRLKRPLLASFVIILVWEILCPFSWRGYAQPRLQEKWGRLGPLVASLIIGIIWAVWHLPEFFNPASTQYALGTIGFFLLIFGEIANSIIMTWLYIKTNGSVLVAGVIWHLAIDLFGSTILLDFSVTGMLAGEAAPSVNMTLFTIQTVVMSISALVLVIATRGMLGSANE